MGEAQPAPVFSADSVNAQGSQGAILGATGPITQNYNTVQQPPRSAAFTLPARRLFVGRAELLNRIQTRLAAGGPVSIVSLKGIGGVGKSALALEAAYLARERGQFDHFHWLDLRSGDATSALRAFLLEIGCANEEQRKGDFAVLSGLLRDHFAPTRALLILDNAERIPKELIEAMRLPPPCATLVTSRTALYPADLRVDELDDADALNLFALSGVEMGEEGSDTHKHALDLIHRLGNLALALTITAQRMAQLEPRQTPRQALAELNTSRNLLEALELSDKPDENVAAAFALTYERLADDLRAAFHALGVCAPSGAPAQAIAWMLDCDAPAASKRLRAMAALSLADYDGQRAELHPLMHEYARLQVVREAVEHEQLIARHAIYFGLEVGGTLQRAIDANEDRVQALELIDGERDNVQTAQERVLSETFAIPKLALQVTSDLRQYWGTSRREPRLYEWLKLAQQIGSHIAEPDQETKQLQANVLQAIGDVQAFRKENDDALTSYQQALALFKQVGDRLGQANSHLAMAKLTDDDALFEQAIAMYIEIKDTYDTGVGKFYYGLSVLRKGDEGKGKRLLQEAREHFTHSHFDYGVQVINGILSQAESGQEATG